MRCKFRATTVKAISGEFHTEASAAKYQQEEIEFTAVAGKENEPWSKYTPYGKLNVHVTNPAAFGTIKAGKDYYIDITPVEG